MKKLNGLKNKMFFLVVWEVLHGCLHRNLLVIKTYGRSGRGTDTDSVAMDPNHCLKLNKLFIVYDYQSVPCVEEVHAAGDCQGVHSLKHGTGMQPVRLWNICSINQ